MYKLRKTRYNLINKINIQTSRKGIIIMLTREQFEVQKSLLNVYRLVTIREKKRLMLIVSKVRGKNTQLNYETYDYYGNVYKYDADWTEKFETFVIESSSSLANDKKIRIKLVETGKCEIFDELILKDILEANYDNEKELKEHKDYDHYVASILAKEIAK